MSEPPAVVGLRVLGVDVDLRVRGSRPEELLEALRERWHLCLRDETDPDPQAAARAVVLDVEHRDDEHEGGPGSGAWRREGDVVVDQDRRRLLQRLTQSVTHAAITARTGELLMLHAAGLAHPDSGATAVFVAPGNTGKTTLCLTLGPARSYLTDETVGIRRNGSVAAYPKPLSVRRPDWVGVKDETAPGAVGLAPPKARPWVAGIILLDRRPGHEGPPLVQDLDLLDAVVALAPESSGFMRTDGPLRWLADVLERTGGARRVIYAEAGDLEPLVAQICARSSPW